MKRPSLDGPLVFIDVDTQRDFLEPTGALYVPGSVEIVPNLERLTRFARANRIPILATACAHHPDDPDPEPFPPHCLIGTHGARRIDATHHDVTLTIDRDARSHVATGAPGHVTIHKRHYDVFTNAAAESLIETLADDDPTFIVYGVATDYCVRAAVEGLLARGRRTAIVADAIRAVDPDNEADVLGTLVEQGALMVLTEVVLASRPAL